MQFWSLTGGEPPFGSPFVSYEEARDLQLTLVELRCQDLIPDTVLFLEHHPVITQGRGLQWTGVQRSKHMPLPAQLPAGVSFSESERGGDLTYHGPGQLVIYPICKLDGKGFGPFHDVAGFLRKLEAILIEDLQSRGLSALSRTNATGIWLSTPNKDAQKIASIGIAVRKWVTFHGLAINCVNDLTPFHLISPCGYNPEIMTRLSDWTKLDPDWRRELEYSLANRMVVPGQSVEIKKLPVELLRAHLKGQEALFGSLGHRETHLALNL